MKIPLIWLKDYIKTEKTDMQIAASFTSLGLMLDKPIENKVLDLEHRFDRSDWLGIYGCARDFAAFEKTELIEPKMHLEKGKVTKRGDTFKGGVEIRVESPDLCNRFNTRVFRNIKVAESPAWLKERLTAYGMPTINNVVDITNYVMVEMGQPLHAQDLAKFEKQEIVIRRAKQGEEIVTLDGTLLKLDPEIGVLSQNDQAIVVMGVVGGKKTSVTTTTTNIVLDAGNYNQASVRKTARKLKIQNETVLRCDKFLNPESTEVALQRATQLILELAGGDYYENYDYYPNPIKPKHMTLTKARLEKLSGMEFELEEVSILLTRLGYKTLKKSKDKLNLEVPYFRTDVEVEDDIIADVLRINGYDNIPLEVISAAPPAEITTNRYKLEDKVRDILVNMGLFEYITDPLVAHDNNNKHQVVLENSLSSEKNALRTNIYQTLRPIVDIYKKHDKKEVGIFEVGKIYLQDGDTYLETQIVTVVYENSLVGALKVSEKIKSILGGLMQNLGIENYITTKIDTGYQIVSTDSKIKFGEITYNSFWLYTEELEKAKRGVLRIGYGIENLSNQDITIESKLGKPFGPIYEKIKNFHPDFVRVEIVGEYFGENAIDNERTVTIRIYYDGNKIQDFAIIKANIFKEINNL